MPGIYDRVHHRDGKHAFFVQGSAAHLLGLCASEVPFVNVDTQETWEGYVKYKPDGGFVKSEEAFAYSCCYANSLLVAVRLAASREGGVKDWMIFLTDLSGTGFAVGACDEEFDSKSLKAGAAEYASILPHIRPGQKLEVVVGWDEAEGQQGFGLKHVELKWIECQRRILSDFALSRSGRLLWPEKVEAALTGRSEAFPELGACPILDAMVVQKRIKWKVYRKEESVPYAVQLTFVAFPRFDKEPVKIWSPRVRHTYNPAPGETILWDLVPDERVRGRMFQEWHQVGSGHHHVLSSIEKVDPAAHRPLLVSQPGGGAKLQVDLFEGGAARWIETWRTEDLKQDMSQRRYWGEHRCTTSDAVQILDDDDDDLDVTSVVTDTFLRMEGHLTKRVKREHLKDCVKETEKDRRQGRGVGKAKVTTPAFLDPYDEACQELAQQLKGDEREEKPKEEGVKEEEGAGSRAIKRAHEEHQWHGGGWNWKGDSSWGSRSWQRDDWRDDWRAKSRARCAVPPPPPPPPPAGGPFRHLPHAVPHIYGQAASDKRLQPLVRLRMLLETLGIACVGDLASFEERMMGVVWDCLPHLADDGSFGRLMEESLRECGIHPLETYGLSVQTLAAFSRVDIQTVFGTFSPAPVRYRSADFATVFPVRLDATAVERLAAWAWWLSMLKHGPRVELFEICLSELPRSWVNSHGHDIHGHHMALLRRSDLLRGPERDVASGASLAVPLLTQFREGVSKLIAETFDSNACWWSTAVLSACQWSVECMQLPHGEVDLDVMGNYFKLLDGVSPQFRKAAQDLIFRVRDAEPNRRMPRSFDLSERRVDFLHTEYVTISVFPTPKWPFE